MSSYRIDSLTSSINKCHYLSTELAYELKNLARFRTVADLNHFANSHSYFIYAKILSFHMLISGGLITGSGFMCATVLTTPTVAVKLFFRD